MVVSRSIVFVAFQNPLALQKSMRRQSGFLKHCTLLPQSAEQLVARRPRKLQTKTIISFFVSCTSARKIKTLHWPPKGAGIENFKR